MINPNPSISLLFCFRWRVGSWQQLNPAQVSISPSLLAFSTSSSPAFGYSMKPSSVQVRRLHPIGFSHGLLHHKPPWAAMPTSSTTKPPEPPCLIENPYQTHQYYADRVTLVVNRIDPSHFWLSFIPPRTKPVLETFFFGKKRARQGYACNSTPTVSVPTRYPIRVRQGFCHTGAS